MTTLDDETEMSIQNFFFLKKLLFKTSSSEHKMTHIEETRQATETAFERVQI